MLIYPAGIPGTSGFTVENSIWFDGSGDGLTDNATPASDSNKKMTMSCWTKRSKLSDGSNSQALWSWTRDNGANDYVQLTFMADDKLGMTLQTTDDGHALSFRTPHRYRDLSAWMHILFTVDTTPSTATYDIWVNGSSIKSVLSQDATPALSQNQTFRFGETGSYLGIGCKANDTSNSHFTGYMAEVAYLNDVTVTDASDFGELNDEGIWIPKDISGLTYGSSSFLYQFGTAPGTSNGAGTDTSGRDNHLTENDTTTARQTTDSPTDNANDAVGNYATINPLDAGSSTATPTFSNGLTTFTRTATSASDNQQAYANQVAVGKKYWEFDVTSNTNSIEVGWAAPGEITGNEGAGAGGWNVEVYVLNINAAGGGGPWFIHMQEGTAGNATNVQTSLDSSEVTTTPRVKFAIDTDNKKYWLGVVHGSYGGWFDTSGTGGQTFDESAPTGTWTSDERFIPYVFGHAATEAGTFYFRDADWTDSAPSGFTAMSTANLPAPTVTDPSAYFKAKAYLGNGIAIGSGGNAIAVGFQPDFVWIKNRDQDDDHRLFDSLRGAENYIESNSAIDQNQAADRSLTYPAGGYPEMLNEFTSTGFNLGSHLSVNTDDEKYIAWCWKAGGAPSATNTGDRTPTANSVMVDGVSTTTTDFFASADIYPNRASISSHGFSMLTYTGTTGTKSLATGLSTKPDVALFKRLGTNGGDWNYVTDVTGSMVATELNNNTGTVTVPIASDGFQTSTITGLNGGTVNDGTEYICYLFQRTSGLIGAGYFEGVANSEGTNVIINDGGSGFRPAFVMIKGIDSTVYWVIHDSARNLYNPVSLRLHPNTNETEYVSGTADIDFTVTGFKHRHTSSHSGGAAETFVYLAFAEHPFGGNGIAQARAR